MSMRKREGNDGDSDMVKGKRHYKLWVIGAITLVAIWSILTGSVTLKWSATNNDDLDSMILEDLDVLEVEEREKVVRNMWDVYRDNQKHSNSLRLPKFWSEAFQAAYQNLVSDVSAVRVAAVSEIAKMSLRSLPLPLQSQSSITKSRKVKQAKSSMDTTVESNQ